MRETKPEQVVQRDVLVAVVCDLCGKREEASEFGCVNWAPKGDRSWWNQTGCELGCRETVDGYSDWTGVDLCYDCAKLIIEKVRNRQI